MSYSKINLHTNFISKLTKEAIEQVDEAKVPVSHKDAMKKVYGPGSVTADFENGIISHTDKHGETNSHAYDPDKKQPIGHHIGTITVAEDVISEEKKENKNVNFYANFISKQLVREGVAINENKEDSGITDKVAKYAGISPEKADDNLSHVASHGKHHTYTEGGEHWSRELETPLYFTHNSRTGETHHFELPKKSIRADEVHKIMNKAIPGGVSREHARAVARDHNDIFGM